MSLRKNKDTNEKTTTKVEPKKKEKNVTKAESEAVLKQQEKEADAGASIEKMKRATALLSTKFNLDESYHVTNFKDGGKVVDTTLENGDFIVTIRVKDSARQGLAIEE